MICRLPRTAKRCLGAEPGNGLFVERRRDQRSPSIQLFFVPFYGESVKLTSKTLKFTSKSAKLTSKSVKLTSKWLKFTSKRRFDK